MMFKKFRKYLIVLMAIVMVASLAVIPVSAADMYGDNSTINYIYDTQNYRYEAWAWAYSDTTAFHADIWVKLGSQVVAEDHDSGSAGSPMAMVSAWGPQVATYDLADDYYHVASCGPV